MYPENNPDMKRNDAVVNYVPGKLYIIEADDKIPDNCKYILAAIQAAKNQKQTNTGRLAKLFKLKISANVILIDNLDIQGRLINGHQELLARLYLLKVVLEKYMKSFLMNKLASKQ